jgi:hypothetical protein
MQEVHDKDMQFIKEVKDNLEFPLENHQVLIDSMYLLLERVMDKIEKLKEYNAVLSQNTVSIQKKLSNEYNFQNEVYKIESELDKNLSTLADNLDLVRRCSVDILNQVNEDFIMRQVHYAGECESSFRKSQVHANISDNPLDNSFMDEYEDHSFVTELTKTILNVTENTKQADTNLFGISAAPQGALANKIKVSKPVRNNVESTYPEDVRLECILPPIRVEHNYLNQEVKPYKTKDLDVVDTNKEEELEDLSEPQSKPQKSVNFKDQTLTQKILRSKSKDIKQIVVDRN